MGLVRLPLEYDSEILTLSEINWKNCLDDFIKFVSVEDDVCRFAASEINPYNQNGLIATAKFYAKDGFSNYDSTDVILKKIRLNENAVNTNATKATIVNNYGIGGHNSNKILLAQNSPNPFSNNTTIKYTVPKNNPATLRIYNIKGEFITELVNEVKSKGTYQVSWDGKDRKGREVVNGIYFYKFNTGDHESVKKMMLIK